MKYLKRFVMPVLLLLAGIFLKYFLKELDISDDEFVSSFKRVGSILLIVSLSWAAIAFIRIIKQIFLEKYDVSKENNLRSRKFQTQFNILERILVFLIVLISIGLILMLFDEVKRIGISLFASAGVAGVIIGLAAQRVIGAVLAGIQIAIAQPIRLDDVVVIEGEWGRIEEITLTYVVVRIWDQRRLVVPSTYFFEKTFQNWTRTSAEIMGTVFIYTDYHVSFDALRKELTRLLESTPLWDKRVNVLQVTDAKQNSVEVRALMSAKDSGTAWDLRVFIREKLIEFLQKNYPESLPRTRVLIEGKENILKDEVDQTENSAEKE
ncbi:Small-conductance mechanosensitive channel [Tangfeifania diversioriginum]|uniref:Small-conductance mechanosensitive channel n=1 Tax=Tangfeifania diversioriginum TaxID=1168035 RepID=A0A1M6AKL7_9BACT|nr:mechanosensitive ion channel domain-containing protein [Tangfeifania diversioriginum]SHI36868.1 Small-conductance mechanosensitive channel [Tangfeifania diversioriginum]